MAMGKVVFEPRKLLHELGSDGHSDLVAHRRRRTRSEGCHRFGSSGGSGFGHGQSWLTFWRHGSKLEHDRSNPILWRLGPSAWVEAHSQSLDLLFAQRRRLIEQSLAVIFGQAILEMTKLGQAHPAAFEI